jgi:hypothetical protein
MYAKTPKNEGNKKIYAFTAYAMGWTTRAGVAELISKPHGTFWQMPQLATREND